jgi:hypothetical protein
MTKCLTLKISLFGSRFWWLKHSKTMVSAKVLLAVSLYGVEGEKDEGLCKKSCICVCEKGSGEVTVLINNNPLPL